MKLGVAEKGIAATLVLTFAQLLVYFEGELYLRILGALLFAAGLAVFGAAVVEMSAAELGLTKKGWKRSVLAGTAVGVALFYAYGFYELLLRGSDVVFKVPFNASVVPVVVAIASSEELYFRGFLFNALKKKLKTYHSAWFSSLLFALYHQNIVGLLISGAPRAPELFLVAFFGGLLLCYAMEKFEGSLLAPISIHVAFDLMLYTRTPFPSWIFP